MTRKDTDDREHLDGLDSGAGCTEIWEWMSETREEEGDEASDD